MNGVPVGQLWSALETMCRISVDDDKIEMKRLLNLALVDICGEYPFRSLRRRTTGTFTASDTSGIVFGANLAGVLGVKDSDGNAYHWRDDTNLREDDLTRRWYYAEPVTTVLATGNNLTIADDLVTISGPTITAAQVGEYIQIGESIGLYQIASTSTITPAFRGTEKERSSVYYAIRPEGTPKIAILDENGSHVAASVFIHHWIYPYPLTQGHHLVPLPSTEPLTLRTAVRYWGDYKGEHEEADRYERRYAKSISECKAMEPLQITPRRNVDIKGRQMVLGRRRS